MTTYRDEFAINTNVLNYLLQNNIEHTVHENYVFG